MWKKFEKPQAPLRRDRRGAVTLMFAAASIPMIALVGLAVDYGIWNQVHAGLGLSADMAAMTAARIAANAQLVGDPNALTEGKAAGLQWFEAAAGSSTQSVVGTMPVTLPSSGISVQVTGGANVIATVTYNGSLTSMFGSFFGVHSYPVSGNAVAEVSSTPYLNVELLLDNSSSMDIGATTSDMQTLMALSACDSSNWVTSNGTGSNASQSWFGNYAYNYAGQVYDGTISTNGGTGVYANYPGGLTKILVPQSPPSGTGISCDPILPALQQGKGYYTGPPCAFACHWDSSANSGLAQDLYGMARRTIGTTYQVTLRFDLVKNATQQILQTMATDNQAINNLNVGIFTFNTTVTQIYPSSGEAGNSWLLAEAAVGSPPITALTPETGIQPVIGLRSGNNDDTAFPEVMTTLQSQYLPTAAGNGTTPASPRKVLIIITDGFLDDPNTGNRSAFPPSSCLGFKNLGYTVYVVYTPYYPVMHTAYLANDWSVIVSGTGTTSISYNLQQCASSASDYISATNQTTLNAALQTFLRAALMQPGRFTL